ncbi:carbonic anhydrase [Heliobacterium gestii]|uniref:Carbonic anhydrase n=1 Tax=Heliomicrobium gestii TaxID=2699 RepID=A0A845LGL2_HELGE|nr:carbonic anhydrase [Heliomicrobium gestii]MBM7868530.1 carbonic anhydrase [Heliomicrobium gestii]MZP44681.1 carbonic anhydrase [Heliomicrobium gestii]
MRKRVVRRPYNQRSFCVIITIILVFCFIISGCTRATKNSITPEVSGTPKEIQQVLTEGNLRFSEATPRAKDMGEGRRRELTKVQKPLAVIVSCSDSRVPPEHIFDQGLGDLFVVRVAGNVVSQEVLGSVEYAVEHLKTPLVIVLGHERCGAVTAAVEGGHHGGSIASITERIRPLAEEQKAKGGKGTQLVERTVDENVRAAVTELKKSPILREALDIEKIKIEGAKYDLDTGKVEWLK